MKNTITIYNENCFDTMNIMPNNSIDVILTSPFYNTNKKAGNKRTVLNTVSKNNNYHYIRYDKHIDNMTNKEYCNFTVKLFNQFDRIIKSNGCILYNLSYGSNNTTAMFEAVNNIITQTNFTIADVIIWKKRNAVPNNCSSNKLTRIVEYIFVFCRKNEFNTFHTNKKVKSVRRNGQKMYENIYNFVEAKNNDGPCPYNKATYSSELCDKLLSLYVPNEGIVYDPFMGSGTTAVSCQHLGLNCIGSEISENQVKFSIERLLKEFKDINLEIF